MTNETTRNYNDGWMAAYFGKRRQRRDHADMLKNNADYAAGYAAGQKDRDGIEEDEAAGKYD